MPPSTSRSPSVRSSARSGLVRVAADAPRLRQIGRMLAERRKNGDEPDVVLLQEAFSGDAERIRSRAGYRYQVVGPNIVMR